MSPRGKLLMFSYESDRVGSVTDHTGRKLRYKYDEKGNLIQVIYLTEEKLPMRTIT